jgi:2-polyprenyl-3-methyl-5-hydroxy-6-metoxy-1,4-benzoquinol methylase
MSYLQYLQNISSSLTFKRKVEYLRFNYGKYFGTGNNKELKVLEIGPGMGECISYLNNKNVQNIDILDNDKNIIEYLESKYKLHKAYCSKDLLEIKNKLQIYDVIIMTEVLEHLHKETAKKWITLLYEHLNKKGIILITVPNMGNPFGFFERYYDITHEEGYTENSLFELSKICGVQEKEISIKSFHIPLYSPLNIIRRFFQSIFHFIMRICFMINGSVYPTYLTPKITLIIKKKV